MNHFQFQTVPNIIAGLGSIQELKNVLSQHQYHKVLLVTDAGMLQHKLHLPIDINHLRSTWSGLCHLFRYSSRSP